MKKQWVLTLLALCLSLFSGLHPILAQQSDDSLAALQQKGWKIVKDGVLQRELVPGEVESFVLGRAPVSSDSRASQGHCESPQSHCKFSASAAACQDL
jgi:hypothetical protein